MVSTAEECYIDLRSYGCNDGVFKGGHIRVNWTMVQSITTTGIYLVLVDPVTCTGRPFPPVNTASGGTAAANVLINYLNIVSSGQVCIPCTFVRITGRLTGAERASIPTYLHVRY